jgi:hypothetical protein
MVKDISRLEALEAALAEQQAKTANFEAEIATLKAHQNAPPAPVKVVQPKPVEEEGTRISYPAPRSLFEMPDAAQLERLAQIVFTKFPTLRPTFSGRWAQEDQLEFDRGFRSAFFALGHIERRVDVDRKRALSFWAQLAEETCRALGRSASIPGSALVVAAVASGNTKYILADRMNGIVPELGLCFGSNMGKLPGNEWRTVLATGQILAPIAPQWTREFYPTPQPKIYGAGY